MSGGAFAVTHHAFSSGAGRTSDGNGSHASTLKSPSYTKSVSWQHYQKVDLNTNEAEIKIKEGGAVSFIFNEETLYFTVFGGDFIMDDLKKVKNTEAWVWYKNCDSKNKNVAVELLQIYELHQ
ncbi:hypothetical protein A155_00906 [Escherichia coli KTE197]|uniref:hypothetical protein n=1 Tax=Escherichia coli TaxID=562 RepID=UPI0002A40A81|nr:hypothetical protein [Escherichia coli]ELH52271.1 hypothetical protein A155_00906 [Escherichia coli KTE197]QBP87235.1 hypothetical protein FORC81_2472 [Escherichia coli]